MSYRAKRCSWSCLRALRIVGYFRDYCGFGELKKMALLQKKIMAPFLDNFSTYSSWLIYSLLQRQSEGIFREKISPKIGLEPSTHWVRTFEGAAVQRSGSRVRVPNRGSELSRPISFGSIYEPFYEVNETFRSNKFETKLCHPFKTNLRIMAPYFFRVI